MFSGEIEKLAYLLRLTDQPVEVHIKTSGKTRNKLS